MAFDENLATRISKVLARKKGIEERKRFGGICFMLNGNMLVGVWKDSLIVRLGNEQGEDQSLLFFGKQCDQVNCCNRERDHTGP